MKMILANKLFNTNIMYDNGIIKLYDSGLELFRTLSDTESNLLESELLKAEFLNSTILKVHELEISKNNADEADISYMSTTFQADTKSQSLIAQNLSIGTVPSGFYWRDSNNVDTTMTYADLVGLGEAIQVRNLANFTKFQDLKSQVNSENTQTQADLDAIVW